MGWFVRRRIAVGYVVLERRGHIPQVRLAGQEWPTCTRGRAADLGTATAVLFAARKSYLTREQTALLTKGLVDVLTTPAS
jgi:hypothetical protein